MKKIIIISVAAMAVASSAHSQINSPAAGGYLDRGTTMKAEANYAGALDQLTAPALSAAPTDERLDALYLSAVSSLHAGRINRARTDFTRYLAAAPTSARRIEAAMALADCDFFQQNYAQALHGYNSIDSRGLTATQRRDVAYRTAYSLMMLGQWDAAVALFADLVGKPVYGRAAQFYLGYIHYLEGDYAKARELMDESDRTSAPGNRAPYYLAQIALFDHDYERALALAQPAIDLVPEFRTEMLRTVGEALFALGQESEALTYIRQYADACKAAATSPAPTASYILGVAQYKDADYEDAVATLLPLTEADDAVGQSACLYVGQSHLRLGNLDAALMALERAYRLNYDRDVRETAFFNYAVAKAEGGRAPFGSSVSMFEDFLKDFPNSRYAAEVREYLINGYMTSNNYVKALESINAVARPSDKLLAAKQRVLFMLGTQTLAAGRPADAIAHFNEARKLAGHSRQIAIDCDLWIGQSQLRIGKNAEAERSLNEYLRSSAASDANRALALYSLAYAQFGQKRYADSQSSFEHLVSSPGSLDRMLVADAYNRLGDCHYYCTDFAGASTLYDKAYAANTAAGDYSLFQKAKMKGLTKEHSAKIATLDKLIEQYPTSGLLPSVLLEKAESFIALNRSNDAIKTYQELVDTYPTTAQGRNGHLQLAITYLSQGNRTAAIDTYKNVVTTYPTSDEARVAIDDLKRLMADDGQLDEFTALVASIPNAPKIEVSELDALTFQAAERAYLNDHSSLVRLKDYLKQYPGGRYETKALSYVAEASYHGGSHDDALAYATTLVERYPDSEASEDALAIKGAVEAERGLADRSLATFTTLEGRASANRNILVARLGIMRASRDLGRDADVVAMADKLLTMSGLTAEQKSEAALLRASAMAKTGREADAINEWEKLSKNPTDLYGTMAAYELADHYFKTGLLKRAKVAVEQLIDSDTPHAYWLARGYILLSDICRRQGEEFEANGYLRSLRENYPGTEPDIFTMIEERLK